MKCRLRGLIVNSSDSKSKTISSEFISNLTLSSFLFKSKNNDKYKALITQELLKKGFLASNTVYSSISHKRYIVNNYLEELEKVFLKIQNCENGQNINKYLDFRTPQKKFERMN